MAIYGHTFDKKTKEIRSTKSEIEIDKRGLGYLLFHSMKKSAEEGLICQIDAVTGHRDTFESFLTRCIRVAISLKNLGVRRGDVISVCSYNTLHSAVPFIAAHFIGATIAPTDPTIAMEDQRHLMNLTKPKVIFACDGSEELLSKAISALKFKCEIVTFARDKCNKYRTFASMIEKQEGEEDFQPVIVEDPSATCVILFSSGTTGLPKGICLNHLFIIYGLSSFFSAASGNATKPRFLIYSSLYWISAVVFQTACFYLGFERVVCPKFDPKMIWECCDKYQVNMSFLAPVQAIKSIEYLKPYGNKLALKVLFMGGSAIAEGYFKRLRQLLPNTLVVNGYGQTEAGMITVFTKKDKNYEKLKSIGVLASNIVAKIVDPETEKALDFNKPGELRVKVKYPMNGYYNQDSSSSWDADGFLKTGDLVYFDSDLCFFLTDRIKEMFKYQSWHIVPAKLEAILHSHPAVELAVVVGISHPIDDNHAVAAVTLMAGATISANELEEYVAQRVDERNRLRAGVVIFDKMPLTPTGKIMRREVKEILKSTVKLRS